MEENKQQNTTENKAQNMPTIQINAQYVKDLSFEAPNMPFILTQMKSTPKISVDIDVKVNKVDANNPLYTVDLSAFVKAEKADEAKTLFVLELVYGSLVSVNLPQEQIEPALLIEIPHLLFPYVRALIANITRESGLPPLQINPIDFAMLYQARLQNQANKTKQ